MRDKFINKNPLPKDESAYELVLILDKIFTMSGFGFIVAHLIELVFNGLMRNLFNDGNFTNIGAKYIVLGVILIFIGLGFKYAKKGLKSQKKLNH